MSTNNELRVFISSTFRDLQEEREHLAKKVFPEIRALCRERGVTFTEVDLRWGLTEEEALLGRVIRTCLEEVDRCRPYFIGVIGNRYGWAPEYHEILMDPDLLGKYPWIEEVAMEGVSVTEMEFIHGVFDAPRVDGDTAFFYHRSGTVDEADDPARLASLIERARGTSRPFREFESSEELGRQVRDDLVAMINRNWPRSEAPSALELERRFHAAFAASRLRAYIPNPVYPKEFTRWLDEGMKPLVVRGASGLGKSSLVAYLTEYYRRKHPTAFVVEHYVGASRASGSSVSVMRHVIEEIRARFGIDEELSLKEQEVERSFANWLFRCEHLASREGIGVLIAVDAVDQLSDAGRRMAWLPRTIPNGIKLLISTTPGETEDRLSEREWESLRVMPLEDERVRRSIVVRYLGEFHKGISPEQVRQVASDAKGSSPLYLRVVAEELRLHGEHETIDRMIERYVGAADLLAVFDLMLERIEHDHGAEMVGHLLSVIWASRIGLSESESMELTGVSRMKLSRLLFAIDYHFVQRDGVLGFFHDYLRRAVEKRYLPDERKQRSAHLQVAEHFHSGVSASISAGTPVSVRMASELAYQLHSVGATDRLRGCLSSMPVFLALYDGETLYEVLGYWTSMAAGTDVAGSYRRGMADWANEDAAERSRGMGRVSDLLQRLGQWSQAIDLDRERLASAIELGRKHDEAASRRSIGVLLTMRGTYAEAMAELTQALTLYLELGERRGVSLVIGNMGLMYNRRGEYDQALECYERQLRIAEELGDRRGVSYAIGNMGNVYYSRGEYERTLECYKSLLRISEELGDRRGISLAIGNMGGVYYSRGEYAQALECYQRQLRITEELGDRSGVSLAIGNLGLVYDSRGEYAQALECYQRQLSIDTELGDRSGVSYAIGNMGLVYSSRGEYQQALECYERQLRIAEELSDRSGVSLAIGNMGLVYDSRGEYEQALESFDRAATEHREIGFRYGLSYWLAGTARVLVELVGHEKEMPAFLPGYVGELTGESWQAASLRVAREQAEECVAISEELSKPDTLFSGRVVLARIAAVEGSVDSALEALRTLLAGAENEDERAECHYRLWKLTPANTSLDTDHRVAAIRLYESLFATTPKHEYRKRIEELSGASEPTPPEAGDAAAE